MRGEKVVNGIFYHLDPKTNTAIAKKRKMRFFAIVNIPHSFSHYNRIFEIVKLDDYLFACSLEITSVNIPDTVQDIGDSVFSNCHALKSVQLGENVTSIGAFAFYACEALNNIRIPKSVLEIGEKAFGLCKSINSIIVEDQNPIYDSRDDCNAIVETANNTLIMGCNNTVIPCNITNINDFAFSHCELLSIIKIPESVNSIGKYAFAGCLSLTTIYYEGTISQWQSIKKAEEWNIDVPANLIHCTDGDVELIRINSYTISIECTYEDGKITKDSIGICEYQGKKFLIDDNIYKLRGRAYVEELYQSAIEFDSK